LGGLKGLTNFEKQEIHSFHKLQYAFISMDDVTIRWLIVGVSREPGFRSGIIFHIFDQKIWR